MKHSTDISSKLVVDQGNLDEIASILAAGIIRLRQKEKSREILVDSKAFESVHRHKIREEINK